MRSADQDRDSEMPEGDWRVVQPNRPGALPEPRTRTGNVARKSGSYLVNHMNVTRDA